jgi:hypothetical protein
VRALLRRFIARTMERKLPRWRKRVPPIIADEPDKEQRLTRIALIIARLFFHLRRFVQFASSSVSFLLYLRRSASIGGFRLSHPSLEKVIHLTETGSQRG